MLCADRELKDAVETLRIENEALEKRIEELQSELDSTRTQAATAEEMFNTLLAYAEDANGKAATAEQMATQKRALIEPELRAAYNELADAAAELKALQQRGSAAVSVNSHIAALDLCSDAEIKITMLQRTLSSGSENVQFFKTSSANHQKAAAEQDQELARLAAEADCLSSQLCAAEELRATLLKLFDEVQAARRADAEKHAAIETDLHLSSPLPGAAAMG